MTPDPDQPAEQQVQIVQPQPIPVTTGVGSASLPDGSPLVAVSFASFTGQSVYFLDRDQAIEFASNIRRAAQTGPKLVAPPAGFQVPRT